MSVIVPCYNEENSIPYFYKEINNISKEISDLEMEFIFIDDGSNDNTYKLLKDLNKSDSRVKCISFSRNFGKEAAIFSGLRVSKGDCCVVIDVDLQHPPEMILKMYKLWKEGYEIIEGVKNNREKEKKINRVTSKIFNKIISKLVGADMEDASDFKLMDRKVVDALANLNEYNTFFRALSYWIGFKSTKVYYDVKERVASKTKWSFWYRCIYSVRNIMQFTYKPLYLIIFVGIIIFIIGIVAGIDATISYFFGNAASGYTTLLLMSVISTGGIMISLGIVGLYIAKIYDEVKKRPRYIIKSRIE